MRVIPSPALGRRAMAAPALLPALLLLLLAAGAVDAAANQLTSGYVLRREDLPVARPVQPWPYKQLSDATSAPQPLVSDATGVAQAAVALELMGLSVKMLMWWFKQDQEKVVPYIGEPGKNYSMYLIRHPKDHCHIPIVSTADPSGPKNDVLFIKEFFGASRPFTFDDYAGFNDTAKEVQIAGQFKYTAFSPAGLTMTFTPLGTKPLSQIKVVWSDFTGADGQKGVKVTTRFNIGNTDLPKATNTLVVNSIAGGASPTALLRKMQVHNVEEFGNIEKVLPGLYAIRDRL